MTVVAWDGKTIVADRQVTNSDLARPTSKLRRLSSGEVISGTGNSQVCIMLMDWYEAGAKKEDWPAVQQTEDLAVLVVASAEGLKFYDRFPVALSVETEFYAFGAGRDYAMGAMAHGASALEAVQITNRLCVSCGHGADVMELRSEAPALAVVNS